MLRVIRQDGSVYDPNQPEVKTDRPKLATKVKTKTDQPEDDYVYLGKPGKQPRKLPKVECEDCFFWRYTKHRCEDCWQKI